MKFLLIAALAVIGSGANAAVLTFDAVSGYTENSTYYEDDFVVTANNWGISAFDAPGTVHIDDFGAPFPSAVTFRRNGFFNLLSIDFLFFGQDYRCDWMYEEDEAAYGPFCDTPPFEAAKVTGYRGDQEVASTTFYAVSGERVGFLPTMRKIDSFVLTFDMAAYPQNDDRRAYSCNAPCTHFTIDNVRYQALPAAAVPLPPAVAALMFGIGALWSVRRRGAVTVKQPTCTTA